MTWWHWYLIAACWALHYTDHCLTKHDHDFSANSRFALVVAYLVVFALWPLVFALAAVSIWRKR